MKIANIGGSNSILKHSYTNILNDIERFTFTNKAIGATNSIYSLVQNLKFDLIAQNDLLIFEYFVNDCNFDVQKINNIDRIHKTLIEILKVCQTNKTKVLFVMIYNIEDFQSGAYDTLASYQKYVELIHLYDVPYIDSNELFATHSDDSLDTFYQDSTHLNHRGMSILSEEIVRRVDGEDLHLCRDVNEVGFNGLSLQKIPPFLTNNTKNFSNSLINVDYIEVSEKALTIEFDRETSILAIEYLCDEYSGYIEIENTQGKIQKNTLKSENLIFEKGKKLASIVTFNAIQFSPSNKYSIKIISRAELSRSLLDRERVTYITKSELVNLKIASILFTNNAKLTNCYFS